MQIKNKCIKITIVSAIINGGGLGLMSLLVFIIISNVCNSLISTELCNENPLMQILRWMCVASLIIGTIGGGIFGWMIYKQKIYNSKS